MAFRLAHVSDLHVLDLSGARPGDFLNKRLTGGATLALRRRKHYRVEAVQAAVEDLRSLPWDHVAVTGDVTNLSLASEFQRATEILRPLGSGDPARMSLVPGNHDVYTRESRGRFEQFFAAYLKGEGALAHGETYPYVKLLSAAEGDPDAPGVAVIGVSTAVPTPWFMATGRVGEAQRERLKTILADPDVQPRLKVVLLHHPLMDEPRKPLYWMRKLQDADEMQAILAEGAVDLVLHGHNHIRHIAKFKVGNSTQSVRVDTAASTANVGNPHPKARARYVIYGLEPRAGGAVCELAVRTWDAETKRFGAAPDGPIAA